MHGYMQRIFLLIGFGPEAHGLGFRTRRTPTRRLLTEDNGPFTELTKQRVLDYCRDITTWWRTIG
jgi:hypothetical protein